MTAQKEAEGTSLAELVEKQNASKAMLVEAQAEADAQLAKAKARAEEIAAVGAAEASAIQAKGQAEALVLKEKNQTYQYMGEAGITDIVMNKMPEIAGAIAAPLSKTEKMVFISQDDATGSKSRRTSSRPSRRCPTPSRADRLGPQKRDREEGPPFTFV